MSVPAWAGFNFHNVRFVVDMKVSSQATHSAEFGARESGEVLSRRQAQRPKSGL